MKTISIRHYFNYVLICTEIWVLTNGLFSLLYPLYSITYLPLILGSFIGGLSYVFSNSRFYKNTKRFYLGLFIIISLFSAVAVFFEAYNFNQTDFLNPSHINIWAQRIFVFSHVSRFKYAALRFLMGNFVPNIIWIIAFKILNSKDNKNYYGFTICFSLLIFFVIFFLIIIKIKSLK